MANSSKNQGMFPDNESLAYCVPEDTRFVSTDSQLKCCDGKVIVDTSGGPVAVTLPATIITPVGLPLEIEAVGGGIATVRQHPADAPGVLEGLSAVLLDGTTRQSVKLVVQAEGAPVPTSRGWRVYAVGVAPVGSAPAAADGLFKTSLTPEAYSFFGPGNFPLLLGAAFTFVPFPAFVPVPLGLTADYIGNTGPLITFGPLGRGSYLVQAEARITGTAGAIVRLAVFDSATLDILPTAALPMVQSQQVMPAAGTTGLATHGPCFATSGLSIACGFSSSIAADTVIVDEIRYSAVRMSL